MKITPKLKSWLTKSVLAFLALPVSIATYAQTQQITDAKNFKIAIEKTEDGIRLKSIEGSAWVDLRFSTDTDKPQAIDEYGMAKLDNVSPAKDPELADFLFTIAKTEKGIVLKGIDGVAWNELSFTLPQNGKQMINRFGMTE